MRRLTAIPAALLTAALLVSCSGDDGDDVATDPGLTTPTGETVDCAYPDDAEPAVKEVSKPPTKAEATGTHELTMKTNAGDIVLTLEADGAPCAVNSFRSLAEQGYFDDTQCHRLVVDFVLQCGDPSATGRGGPGYSFADELTGSETYTRGTLAMANAGPDTNGSQFFIVTDDSGLNPAYTVFGSVDEESMKVVDAIEAKGNGPDQVAPAEPVEIESIG